MTGSISIGKNAIFYSANLVGVEVVRRTATEIATCMDKKECSEYYLQLWVGNTGAQFDITDRDAREVMMCIERGYLNEKTLLLEGT